MRALQALLQFLATWPLRIQLKPSPGYQAPWVWKTMGHQTKDQLVLRGRGYLSPLLLLPQGGTLGPLRWMLALLKTSMLPHEDERQPMTNGDMRRHQCLYKLKTAGMMLK